MNNPSHIFLVVDDDERFRERLAKSLRLRGYTVFTAGNHQEALHLAEQHLPTHATVDLRLPEAHGLDILRDLRARVPQIRIVVLTGYGSIATTVEAMRLGAIDYLTKPTDTDRILAAFNMEQQPDLNQDDNFTIPSLARLEWEHIERVLRECNGNISMAARVLGMHRRTLQYKLAKFPVAR